MESYFETQSKCEKVRIIAAAFGYGPRVAAETMAEVLNLKISEWQLHSTPLKNEDFEITFNFGVAEPKDEPKTSYRIWVDCLMWLRNKIPKAVVDYDLFLAENFFSTKSNLIMQIDRSKIRDIEPLYSLNSINNSHSLNTSGHLLVSFGGVETPFTTDRHRYAIPEIVLESLVHASRKLNDKREILCCLPSLFLNRFKENPLFSSVKFISPNHKDFLSILTNSSLYIVQPGLYGPFEAFENGVSTVFTTPFSYTQVCQAKAFDKENLMGYVPMWDQLNFKLGGLIGEIEKEEEHCFKKIDDWISQNLVGNNLSVYYEWAESLLRIRDVSKQLTLKRLNYIKKRKNRNFIQLKEVIKQKIGSVIFESVKQ